MDGLHINVLVVLIFLKLYPDIIKEGRLKIILPPLYCAKNKKEFIPIYNVEDYEKYKKDSKYTCQRLKGKDLSINEVKITGRQIRRQEERLYK